MHIKRLEQHSCHGIIQYIDFVLNCDNSKLL